MNKRSEQLLKDLLANPGQMFFLKKSHDQRSKKEHNRERKQAMQEVETSLKLLGIKYSKFGDFKIKILRMKGSHTKNAAQFFGHAIVAGNPPRVLL